MTQAKIITLILLALLFMQWPSKCLDLAIIDFLENPTNTDSSLSNNYIGMTMEYEQIEHLVNDTIFQGYMRVTHTNANWMNMIFSNLRLPYDWNYNCAVTAPNITNSIRNKYCTRDLQSTNDTLLDHTISYAANSQPQPYWTFGFARSNSNATNTTVRRAYTNLINKLILGTTGIPTPFQIEFGYAVNKYVEKDWRPTNFTPNNFISELAGWSALVGGILLIRSPGLTEDAPEQWTNIMTTFFRSIPGVFTFEATIFNSSNSNSSLSITDLLNSNNIKNYLKNKTHVNSTFSYANFATVPVAFSSVKLTPGSGINGVTNSFAAGLWWIEFVIESSIFGVYDVSIDGTFQENYYQSMWEVWNDGVKVQYRPSIFFYASNFVNLAAENFGKISHPDIKLIVVNKIKVYGFETLTTSKYLILNKNENETLKGQVVIKTRSSSTTFLKCISFNAQNLSSTNNFTIAGHYYDAGKAEPQGPYEEILYKYDENSQSYRVNIGYAEALLCEIPNANMIIPTGKSWEKGVIVSIVALIVLFGL